MDDNKWLQEPNLMYGSHARHSSCPMGHFTNAISQMTGYA